MPFCPSCGTPAQGRFCAKCGAAVGAVPPPPHRQAPPSMNIPGLSSNLAAALCYIPVICPIAFLAFDPYRKDRSVRFHAFQSLLLTAAYVGAGIVVNILTGMSYHLHFLHSLVHLVWFGVSVLAGIQTLQGTKYVLPFIGPLAEKQA